MPRIPRLGRRGGPEPASAEQETTAFAPAAGTQDEASRSSDTAADAARSFRERGRLRRRLRYLRRVRELALRDLGGLIFDQHRFASRREDLVEAKVGTLEAIDRELRTLESVLEDHQPVTVLREAGIAACPRCGALHGSDAHFCPNCGVPVGHGAQLPIAAGAPAPWSAASAAPAPEPSPTAPAP